MKLCHFKPNSFLLTGSLLVAAIIWFCFGDDLLTARQRFSRFGVEMPSMASNIVVDDQEDAMVIAFRLPPKEASDLLAHPLPGYNGWRRQREDELFPSLGGIPPTAFHDLKVNERRAGTKLWRVLVKSPTGECFAWYDVEDPTPVGGGAGSL